MAHPAKTCSLAEFAESRGVTLRSVTGWIQKGMPHRTVKGERRVVPSECHAWVTEAEVQRRTAQDHPDEAKERARKLRAEADLKELELLERRGQVVPVAQYRERLEQFVGGFAATAAGRLNRFERDIVACTTPAGARKVTQDIHEALMRGAQEYADTLEALQASEEEAA